MVDKTITIRANDVLINALADLMDRWNVKTQSAVVYKSVLDCHHAELQGNSTLTKHLQGGKK